MGTTRSILISCTQRTVEIFFRDLKFKSPKWGPFKWIVCFFWTVLIFKKMDLSVFVFVSFFLGVLSQDINSNYPSTVPSSLAFTEHPGGTIIDDKLIFSRARSPYWLRNDIVVERNAEMIVEPGVTIRVEPQVGITVRGVLTAVVSN